ncbi:putative Zn(II)2Cys6 transcription factor [Hyaloscypha finlandica]|nr:putative Zn(II)2Cys6 transcription factor [Hyaloscypha finlandica]
MDEAKKSTKGPGSTPSRRRAICSNCRRRKSKCDSRQPQCSTCIAHNSHCHYDKPPSLAYVRSLESKIEKLLQERSASSTGRSWQENEHGSVCYHNPTSSFHEAPLSSGRSNSECNPPHEIPLASQESSVLQNDKIKLSLVSNAAAQRRFEAMAVEKMAAVQNEVSSEVASELLKFHWCWIHPMFQFVYRPAFTRGMALSSPNQPETSYFSETLLKVLLAHCARFRVQDRPYQDSASTVMGALSHQAHLSLAMKIAGPSSIPTIQALLQQSAREVAFGNSSQAWLYSGMAFRIAIDLGIHLPPERLRGYVKNLAAEDIEIRKRLFWGCYTWDKAISLYLGRMPAFTPAVESNDPVFMDDFTENDPWQPYYGSEDLQTRPLYSPQKGYMISCFTALCKLSMILSTIMLEIYGSSQEPRPDGDQQSSQSTKNSAFIRISTSIQKWWIDLPEHLRLNIKNLPDASPPLHIVSLNLLYHTTSVLLHRPFIIGATEFETPAISRSYQICIAACASIHDLLELLTNTFGYVHTTYLNCYSTYIAATIAVLHFQLQEESVSVPTSDVPSEKLGLKFFLGVLQKSATTMPGLARSVEIVKRHMQTIFDRRAKRYLESLFPDPSDGFVRNGIPKPTQPRGASNGSQIAGNYQQPYSGFNLEGLPAFPGQNFNVGADYPLEQEIMDPGFTAGFLGLDSHITLHHEDSDWAYSGFLLGDDIR